MKAYPHELLARGLNARIDEPNGSFGLLIKFCNQGKPWVPKPWQTTRLESINRNFTRPRLTLITLFLLVLQSSFGQVVSEWRQQDINLINSVVNLDKSNPKEIESFFYNHGEKSPKDTLGFGWTRFEKTIPGGYISIWADFFYFKDTIQTYIIGAELPTNKDLIEEYRSLYSKFLQIDPGNNFRYKYKEQNILRPLKEYRPKNTAWTLKQPIVDYMSPTSGKSYGYAGGLPITTLQNRRLFNQIKDSLTPSEILTMMYAINPVSRLTAIEYYIRNKGKFKQDIGVDRWIEKVYREVPMIETILGCFVLQLESKTLVEQFAKLTFE